MVALVTLTAPGVTEFPWDTELCSHRRGVRCSGDLGCKVERLPAAAWHDSLARRWSHFVEYLRRDLLDRDLEYFKSYEWQKRGLLHVHALVRVPEWCTATSFAERVQEVATRWGFGHADVRWLPAALVPVELRDGVPPARDPRAAAAGYVAKYVSKGYEELREVVMLAPATGEVSQRCLRPWSTSYRWGDTMRLCKARRVFWWTSAGSLGSDLRSDSNRGAMADGCGLARSVASLPAAQPPLDPYSHRSTTPTDPVVGGSVVPGSVTLPAV